MKKTLTAICIFTLIIFISACGRHVSPAAVTVPDITAVPTSTSTGANYRVKNYTSSVSMTGMDSLSSEQTFIYANGGANPTGCTGFGYEDGVVSTIANFVYDAYGNTVSGTINFISGGIKASFVGIVESGIVTELQYYDKDGILVKREVYQNDSLGRKTRIDYYDNIGSLEKYEVYQYNAAGQITRLEINKGIYSQETTEYFYNASGKLARVDSYTGSTLSGYTVYYFDTNGFNSGAAVFGADDVQIYYQTITCDERGNILTRNSSMDFGNGHIIDESMVCAYNEADLLTYAKITAVSNYMGDISITEIESIIQYETY